MINSYQRNTTESGDDIYGGQAEERSLDGNRLNTQSYSSGNSQPQQSRLSNDHLFVQEQSASRSLVKNKLHDLEDSPLTNANNHTHLVEEPEMI